MFKNTIRKIFQPRRFKFAELFKYIKFEELPISQVLNLSRDNSYEYFDNYFKFKSSKLVKTHRWYFKQNKRGYGEDAFHAMWEVLIKNFKPNYLLEIGVYRGQIISLFELLVSSYSKEFEIWGISPLDNSSDSVSEYKDLDYHEDIKKNFDYFKLSNPNLLNSYSNDTKAKKFISEKIWDFIYIDGSHEYEFVKRDINNCLPFLKKGGLLILDDSSLYEDFNLSLGNKNIFKGHPGPSKAMQELKNSSEVSFYLGVGHNNIFIKK